MKIFYVLHGFPPEVSGGTERTVEALARATKRKGHEVAIVCGSLALGSPAAVEELEYEGLRVLRLHRDDLFFESWFKSYHPSISATLEELFKAQRPDVVHIHHWLRLTSDVGRIARHCGATVAITLHDYYAVLARVARRMGEDREDELQPPDTPDWMPALEAREDFDLHRRDFHDELRAAHIRLVPSRAHAEGLQSLAPESRGTQSLGTQSLGTQSLGTLQVTAPPLLSLPGRMKRTPDPEGHRLVTWGSVYAEKGLESVFDAMEAAGPDWQLQVLGEAHDPVYREAITRQASGLQVTFTGAFETRDLEQVEADFALLPSLCHESYGLVLDEAQALGLPVIASDLPAYREHARGSSCLFYRPGDAHSLAALLQDRERLRQLEPPPPPAMATAADCAEELLALYRAVDRRQASEPKQAVRDRQRAEFLFRRAERRLWTALTITDGPRLPPDGFLGRCRCR